MSDLRPYLLSQNKSVHHFQNAFFKQEPSPSKSHRKQLEQHGSPNHLSTSLSFSKSFANKPQQSQSDTSYVYYLIQQIKQMEQTIEELKQENHIQCNIPFANCIEITIEDRIPGMNQCNIIQDLQFQHNQMNKYHNILKFVQQVKLDIENQEKSIEQMNLMMKIHLSPVNEMLSQLIHPETNVILQKELKIHQQSDSINESTLNVKIHANISKYQSNFNKYSKCKTETQFKDQK